MAQRSKPRIDQHDIDDAVAELSAAMDIESLSKVDKFFALDLMQDYGKWAAIAGAAWRSIVDDGLTARTSSGGKGNRHYRMVKSESIDIFKAGIAMKTQLAAKISKFVSSGTAEVEEEMDEFDAFNA